MNIDGFLAVHFSLLEIKDDYFFALGEESPHNVCRRGNLQTAADRKTEIALLSGVVASLQQVRHEFVPEVNQTNADVRPALFLVFGLWLKRMSYFILGAQTPPLCDASLVSFESGEVPPIFSAAALAALLVDVAVQLREFALGNSGS